MIILGVGSNTGDREKNLRTALQLLEANCHIQIQTVSSLYETEPVGFSDQPSFLNAVVLVITELGAEDLLACCLAVEVQMGRARERRWGPRNIDIDLLCYNDLQLYSASLTVPHPRIKERKFVLVPMLEAAGDFEMADGGTVDNALQQCRGKEAVTLYKPAGWERGDVLADA
jgi:2-amino-4-hydroxy-6-hydroxymethyldihydropteridine diphosphokinase